MACFRSRCEAIIWKSATFHKTLQHSVSISILKSVKWLVFQKAALSCPFCVSRQPLQWQNSASGSLGAGDKKINSVARKEEGIIVGISYSIPGHVGVRTSSVLSTPVSRRGDFLRTVAFEGNVFKVEQGLNCLHFMYFRTFKAISNAWKLFLVHDWRKLKFPTPFNQLRWKEAFVWHVSHVSW